ncbi:hypothetical protein [Chitinophaga costaii]|uniref:hypothetical protein n=1 Tax=Chitinophaga costaii TaxID=1335309 RepID=UPI001112111B|nr:hypothetical protein [Chitinophaga costaii]
MFDQLEVFSNLPAEELSIKTVSDPDLLNLCGGIPIAAPTNFKMYIEMEATNVYELKVFCDQFYVNRTIDLNTKIIYNNTMIIPDAYRGNGVGTNLFLNQVKACRELAFGEINVLATSGAGYTGHRHWGRVGFSQSTIDAETFQSWCLRLGFHQPNLFELLKNEEGYKFWTELGPTWFGTFKVEDDSQNMSWLREYIQIMQRRNEGIIPIAL